MSISDRIATKVTSARAVSILLLVLTVCIGALWIRSEPWLALLSNVISFLLGNYVSKQQSPPGSGTEPQK